MGKSIHQYVRVQQDINNIPAQREKALYIFGAVVVVLLIALMFVAILAMKGAI
jgi:hypothetical protein